jgi:hypothetical protein
VLLILLLLLMWPGQVQWNTETLKLRSTLSLFEYNGSVSLLTCRESMWIKTGRLEYECAAAHCPFSLGRYISLMRKAGKYLESKCRFAVSPTFYSQTPSRTTIIIVGVPIEIPLGGTMMEHSLLEQLEHLFPSKFRNHPIKSVQDASRWHEKGRTP